MNCLTLIPVLAGALLSTMPSDARTGGASSLAGERAGAPDRQADPQGQRRDRVETERKGKCLVSKLKGFTSMTSVQREPTWCWAACVQMVQRFNGIEASQAEIAERIHGVDADGSPMVRAATYYEILCALNPDIERSPFTELWKSLGSQALDSIDSIESLSLAIDRAAAIDLVIGTLLPSRDVPVEELRMGHPAIVGLRGQGIEEGHAYVLIGCRYKKRAPKLEDLAFGIIKDKAQEAIGDELGKNAVDRVCESVEPKPFHVKSVFLVDPYEGTIVRLKYKDFEKQVDFVISRERSRQILLRWRDLAQLESE